MPTVPDRLLAAVLDVPDHPTIVVARSVPHSFSTAGPADVLDRARRAVLARNAVSAPLDSFLPSIEIVPAPALLIFRLCARDSVQEATATLTSLDLDGLASPQISSFTLDGLYPCSTACSYLQEPCPSCPASPSPSVPASLLPRKPLRHFFSHFLDAIRTRLIDDIASASLYHPDCRPVQRLKGGFLLGQAMSSTQWADSWAYRTLSKPLLYCQLQIHLSRCSPLRLIVHPHLLPTNYLPLLYAWPLPVGTPITLLPYETPAYYLTHYSGPTSAVVRQFQDSLEGLGLAGWDSSPHRTGKPSPPQFIVAWINVENKQGEDKGIVVIYPTSLCLSFSSSSSSPFRPPLQYIPQLPLQLQPSPLPVAAGHSPTLSPFTTETPISISLPASPYPHSRPVVPNPSTSPYLRALRTLTLTKAKDLTAVAAEVGSYVDAVARERERERERLKRERENNAGPSTGSPQLTRLSATVPPSTTAPVAVPIVTAVHTTPTDLSISAPAPAAEAAASSLSNTSAQNFYPSPPQTNVPIISSLSSVAGSTSVLDASSPVPAASAAAPPHEPTSSLVPATSTPHTTTDAPVTGSNSASFDDPFSYLGGMNIDMDFDMSMGMDITMDFDMPTSSHVGVGGTSRGMGGSSMDYDDATAFTDDDFSFFDRPSASVNTVPSVPPLPTPFGSLSNHSTIPPPPTAVPSFGVPSNSNTFAHPSTLAHSHLFPGSVHPGGPLPLSPLVSLAHTSSNTYPHHGQQTPAATPRSPWAMGENLMGADYPAAMMTALTEPSFGTSTSFSFPFSPEVDHKCTPSTYPHPYAPSIGVHLDSRMQLNSSRGARGGFEPVPFAAYHRELDGKYAMGKFKFEKFAATGLGLPSPPAEDGEEDGHDQVGFDQEERQGQMGNEKTKSKGLGTQLGSQPLSPAYFLKSGAGDGILDFYVRAKALNGDHNITKSMDDGWGREYVAATDPRVGVMKKLKRKIAQHGKLGHKERENKDVLPAKVGGSAKRVGERSRSNTQKKKRKTKPSCTYDDEDDGAASDTSSISSTSSATSISSTPSSTPGRLSHTSRPSTPAPSYLPLGPTLIHMRFMHSSLLPLSTPLRSPGATTTASLGAGPIPSVPTPVSPAAMLTANSERSRSLEAAARAVAGEVVENALWGEAWGVGWSDGSAHSRDGNTTRSRGRTRRRKAAAEEAWLGDVKIISQFLAGIKGVQSPVGPDTLFRLSTSSSSSPLASVPPRSRPSSPPKSTISKALAGSSPSPALQLLTAPMITVGKSDSIIQILPPAVRFWEKLGLGPRGGRKDAAVFVLFEEGGEQRMQQVESWWDMVAAMYESKHFGTLVRGESSSCSREGFFPLRFDSSIRKSLTSFLSALPSFSSNILILSITPLSIMSLTSPILRQILSSVKKTLASHSSRSIYFQFVPEHIIYGSLGNPTAFFDDLDTLCVSIYNRILTPVDRSMAVSRRSPSPQEDEENGKRKYFQNLFLTLARPLQSKVSFVRSAHASLGVLDRNTFLHVGYQVSLCGKWVLAACVDQRGEAYDLGVWLVQGHSQDACATPGRDDENVTGSGSGSGSEHSGYDGGGENDTEDVHGLVVKKVWQFAMTFARNADVEWRVVIAKLGSMDEGELNAWAGHLNTFLSQDTGMPRLLVTVVSAEPSAPWTFSSTQPPSPKSPAPPAKVPHSNRSSSSTGKNHSQMIFTDITTTVYAVPPYTHLPQSLPPSLSDVGPGYIPEPSSPLSSTDSDPTLPADVHTLPHSLALLPTSTTTLICVPCSSPSPTALTMLHIHLLHITQSHRRSSPHSETELVALHNDITRNFHDLAVLKGVQWRMRDANPLLPFHLAAVDRMAEALEVDWGGGLGIDGSVGTGP